jgi:hypothetical protein
MWPLFADPPIAPPNPNSDRMNVAARSATGCVGTLPVSPTRGSELDAETGSASEPMRDSASPQCSA